MTAPAAAPKYRIDFQKSHTVYKNIAGDRVPGVTTVLGMLNKPALLKWAWQMGKDGRELDAVRQGAADIGTVAHALCEAYLRGMELDSSNITPEALSKAETGFLRFLDFWDKEGLKVVRTELVMISEAMQVGGTMDVLAQRPDGRLVVVDLKTSKGIYDEMLVQVATYAAMYEEGSRQKVDEVYIVRIGKEDADDLEIRQVGQRPERVAAFTALASARRLLQKAGMRV
jgi:CRISPR/Cas system-associated exonuclease Cas4 (RecB family)